MSRQPSRTISLDAPVEGWNAFHAKDNMPPTAAITLENIIPGAGKCETRKGSSTYADLGTGLPVETVASFVKPDTSELLAASNGKIFSVSNDDTPIVTELKSGFGNNRWQHVNFTKADENPVIILSNGFDTTQVYDGTTMSDLSTTGSDPAVSANFIGQVVFKGRVYYWKDNDNAFYYSQAGSYQGNIQKFDLGTLTRRGGKLVLITTWTQADSGDSTDDLIVFVFSTGEILIYQGDDPESTGYFEIVGKYLTAEPLSIRGAQQYGSDTILMTKDGYVALSTIMQQGRTSDVPAFSRLIHSAVTQATEDHAELFGWESILYPKAGLFIFNVPTSEETFVQHVLNTVTMRWCKFTNLNVSCMTVHMEQLYGGTPDGKIKSMLQGTSDEGSAIYFTCLYAYQTLDDPGIQKGLMAAQIISTHPVPRLIDLRGYNDFEEPILGPISIPTETVEGIWSIDPATPPSGIGSYWDEDDWAVESNPITTKGWQNVSAFGFGVSLMVRFALVNQNVVWRSTGLRYYLAGSQ